MLNKTCASALGIILCFMLLAQSPVIAGTNLIASSSSNIKVWNTAYYNGYTYVFYQQGDAAYYKYSSDGGVTWSSAYSLGFSADLAVNQHNNRIVITWWVDTTHMNLINGTIGDGAITFSSAKTITHPRAVGGLSRTAAFHPTDVNIIYMAHGSAGALSFTMVNISAGVETERWYVTSAGLYFFTTILGNYCIIYTAQSSTITVRTYHVQTGATNTATLSSPADVGTVSYYGAGSTMKISNDLYGVVLAGSGGKAVLVKFSLTDTGIVSACPGVVDDEITTYVSFNFAQIGPFTIGIGGTSDNYVYRYFYAAETNTFVNKTQIATAVVDNPIRARAVVLNSSNFGVAFTKYQDTYYNLYVDMYKLEGLQSQFASLNITINTNNSFAELKFTIVTKPNEFGSIIVTINTQFNMFGSIIVTINTQFNAFSTFSAAITTKITSFGMITAYIVANGTYQPPGPPGPGEQPGGGGGVIELPYQFSANYIALALLLLIPTVVIKQQVGSFATIPTLTVMWIISFFAQLISLGLFVIGLVILIAFMFRRRMQGEVEV